MKNIVYVLILVVINFNCKEAKKEEAIDAPFRIELDESVEALSDSIQIKNIQVGSDTSNDKNKLHISYPSTVYNFINNDQEAFAQSYLKEFEAAAKGKNEEAIAGLDFGQHFELVASSPTVLTFLIERYTSYGNNYDTQFLTYVYDVKDQKRLPFSRLFSPKENFEKLATIVQSETKAILKEKIAAMEGVSASDKEALWNNAEEMLIEGTMPSDENYDGFSWDASGKLTIYFDKYQVASGNFGAIEVKLSPDSYRHLVAEKYLEVFLIPAEKGEEILPTEKEPKTAETSFEVDCSKEPCVAITFDDGPAKYTTQLLDILKKHEVKATFFVLGKSAKVQKNTLLRAYKEGHQIGNHSWDHKDLKRLSEEAVIQQINETNEVISNIIGEDVQVLRPPYGSLNDMVKAHANMPIILWNLDPLDWKDRKTDIVAERISEASINGIVLAHDIHPSTVAAMPQVISNLKAKGYHLVTIENLFAGKELEEGKVYSRRR
ncbi:polysaccharide deacetylase family protein [Oceanihabitans sediminis]|uniref:polysaccharide deacetylase family protein n=1 Tax=Oceanihabitans sediminis TaxID=1812012 RepID=UPI00299E5B2A|nr:polysaccharide deacetylase family protein [Oceanihabitans sediminis]MDX1279104.1 polysaccharide deacetylase family protein [Oceanihabitans sediminis]